MGNFTQWETSHGRWSPTGATSNELKPGFYMLYGGMGAFLQEYEPKHDKGIVIADSISAHLSTQLKKFHQSKDTFAKFNVLHKRGILLEGPPGSGKTMSALIAAQDAVRNGWAVILPYHAGYFQAMPGMMQRIREIHPNLPLLCILEDIDNDHYTEDLDVLLSLLDGENQVGNVFFVATTNHKEKLDPTLTNRPCRFDEVIHVGPPSADARRSYLEQIVPADQSMRKEAIDAMVHHSEGLMLAHLRELMIAYLVLDYKLEEAAKRLKAMGARPSDDDIMGGPSGDEMQSITITGPASALRQMTTKKKK